MTTQSVRGLRKGRGDTVMATQEATPLQLLFFCLVTSESLVSFSRVVATRSMLWGRLGHATRTSWKHGPSTGRHGVVRINKSWRTCARGATNRSNDCSWTDPANPPHPCLSSLNCFVAASPCRPSCSCQRQRFSHRQLILCAI